MLRTTLEERENAESPEEADRLDRRGNWGELYGRRGV
jgi:hypothetical protein